MMVIVPKVSKLYCAKESLKLREKPEYQYLA